MVISTTQSHSTKPELRFWAGSNPTHGMLQMVSQSLTKVPAGNKADDTTKTINHHNQNYGTENQSKNSKMLR